ncbi:uncharacterized protein LOC114305745 [Camellia sinensis]|uniref:uncharacterized protein LOC114305745 n=1 Tax=Camellia sinensis TaxID=4442 RepID=UPI001036B898|nr:uncharacterized protein LOC114305745 [Camellia sinensis]
MKELKLALKQWNSEVFGNINTKLKQAKDELHQIDLVEKVRELVEAEKARRREVSEEAGKLYRMVEWMWLQKSRLNWDLKEDKNTKYFHVVVKSRQGRNEINSLSIGDEVFEDPNKVKQEVQAYFQRQYKEEWRSRLVLEGSFKSVRNSPFFDLMESEFSEAEIRCAITDCDGNKALGPDRLNLACVQKMWKILSKVLSSRLKAVLPQIISENQSAFVGGMNILDSVLVANEVVDGWKKSRNFEKVYDLLNWDFLFSMMINFGFGEKWMGWIKERITSSRLFVLVNGVPTGEFSPQRGLRQGDSLSPFLFNIVAEGLNILLSRALDMELIKGVKIGAVNLYAPNEMGQIGKLWESLLKLKEESLVEDIHGATPGKGKNGAKLTRF